MYKQRTSRRAQGPRKDRHGRAGGFTLIELLVVIAILSLLVSILLPALARAKDMAKDVICVTNLRTIGQTWQFYLADTDGVFPYHLNNTHWFYGGKHPSYANELDPDHMLDSRPLNPYVSMSAQGEGGTGLFRCAKDRQIIDPDGISPMTHGHTSYEYYGNSYMLNAQLLWSRDPVTRNLISDRNFRRADIEVAEAELLFVGDAQWYYSMFDTRYDAHFHNDEDRMGLLFFDGHAAFTQIIRGEAITPQYTVLTFVPPSEEQ